VSIIGSRILEARSRSLEDWRVWRIRVSVDCVDWFCIIGHRSLSIAADGGWIREDVRRFLFECRVFRIGGEKLMRAGGDSICMYALL